eukprot:gene11096-biopygen7784
MRNCTYICHPRRALIPTARPRPSRRGDGRKKRIEIGQGGVVASSVVHCLSVGADTARGSGQLHLIPSPFVT